jgi:phosphate transport system protein
MEKIERHFERELERLGSELLRLGGLVEQAIDRSVQALVERDVDLARRVIEEDEAIDSLENDIDVLCTDLLALRQPLARDLRYITTALKITPDLERIADHAVNISERAIELASEPPLKPLIDIPRLAQMARSMVHDALDAFVRRDAEAARAIIPRDEALDRLMEQIFRELLSFMIEDPRTITRAMRLIFVAKYFERIGDQATNVCEMVVYMVEGRIVKHGGLSAPH